MRFKIVWVIGFGALVIAAAFTIWGGTRPAAANQSIDPANFVHPDIPTDTYIHPEAFPLSLISTASSDFSCRQCHGDTEAVVNFPSGESVPARVDLPGLDVSAHGTAAEPLACTSCHNGNDYHLPHTELTAGTLRQYQLEKSAACESCHTDSHITSHEGLPAGETVVCTDCHGAHNVPTVNDWNEQARVDNCLTCHESAESQRLSAVIAGGLFTHQVDEQYCLSCHTQPGPDLTFENGDQLSVLVDPAELHASVHGDANSWGTLTCRNCHEMNTYPHPPVESASARDYSLAKTVTCAQCHDHNYELALDSVHGAAQADGNKEAAVCTDCHGSHATQVPDEPRTRISSACRQCHSTIYDQYATSIHGDALLSDDNPDVPTCIDCHGVHRIADPTTNLFRARSPLLCANCHANQSLMAKYDISTQVFDTYVADFHGTTVTLFEHQDPTIETNKAVCYDCHGVHDIKAPDDPEAGIKTNLLATCQKCHLDATANFPDAWTSHFEPSPEHNPLVYYVNLFYRLVIPITVVSLGFLVSTDIYRRVRERFSKKPRS